MSPFFDYLGAHSYWVKTRMRNLICFIFGAILLTFFDLIVPCLIYAADVPFSVKWQAVTTKIDGSIGIPSGYRVYACNQPIDKSPWLTGTVNCAGMLSFYDTTNTELSDVYQTSTDSGIVYFRVTAFDEAGNESPLSNMAFKTYSTISLTFQPPSALSVPG